MESPTQQPPAYSTIDYQEIEDETMLFFDGKPKNKKYAGVYFLHHPDKKIIEFGRSRDLRSRIKTHKTNIKNMYVDKIIECYKQIELERKIAKYANTTIDGRIEAFTYTSYQDVLKIYDKIEKEAKILNKDVIEKQEFINLKAAIELEKLRIKRMEMELLIKEQDNKAKELQKEVDRTTYSNKDFLQFIDKASKEKYITLEQAMETYNMWYRNCGKTIVDQKLKSKELRNLIETYLQESDKNFIYTDYQCYMINKVRLYCFRGVKLTYTE
jgi:hypothetical protein